MHAMNVVSIEQERGCEGAGIGTFDSYLNFFFNFDFTLKKRASTVHHGRFSWVALVVNSTPHTLFFMQCTRVD